MKKYRYLLFLILIFAIALRFFKLNEVPISMSDDEVRLVYSAYSIWNTGRDLSGNYLPLAFVIHNFAFNPVPIYLVSPIVGLFGLTMFTSRFLFAVAGVLSVFVLYKISFQILKNEKIALLTSFCLTFSAWHLQLSRFAYEGIIALLFNLLGIYLFLNIKKNSYLYLTGSMISFMLAFYSYSGTKLNFVPIILILLWYCRTKLSGKQITSVFALMLAIAFSFVLLGKYQGAARYGSAPFFFQQTAKAAEAVELERRASDAPEFLKKIYHNKLTYWSKIFFDRYAYAVSPQHLFLNQEGSGIFSIWFRGQLFYIEAPLLLIGVFYLFLTKRREFYLLSMLLLIGPLPAALGGNPVTYTIRSSFMLPWLMMFVGSGIYSISYFVKSKAVYAVYAILIIGYIYLIGGYLTQYYFEWMRYGAKHYSMAAKHFVDFAQNNKQYKIIAANTGEVLLFHYAFYNQVDPVRVHKLLIEDPLAIDNITFLPQCIQLSNITLEETASDTIYAVSSPCNSELKTPSVIKALDGEEVEWRIYRGVRHEN